MVALKQSAFQKNFGCPDTKCASVNREAECLSSQSRLGGNGSMKLPESSHLTSLHKAGRSLISPSGKACTKRLRNSKSGADNRKLSSTATAKSESGSATTHFTATLASITNRVTFLGVPRVAVPQPVSVACLE